MKDESRTNNFLSRQRNSYRSICGYEYEVNFASDADITFDEEGKWTKIDPGHKKMPESILSELPKPMADYLRKYSLGSISEIQRWSHGYEVEIDGTFDDFDLYFDADGNFIGKDR